MEKDGIPKHYNVIVLIVSIGMETPVFNVSMVKIGIKHPEHVNACKELNGMVNSV